MSDKSIGENIKKYRKLNSMKQSDLAKELNVSDKTVSSWEINRTEPSIGYIEKMCIIFHCKKTDLIGKDPEWDDISWDRYSQVVEISSKNEELYRTLSSNYVLRTYVEKLSKLPVNMQQYIFNIIDNTYELQKNFESEDNK